SSAVLLNLRCGGLYGFDNSRMRPTAADIALQALHDLLTSRMRIRPQQGNTAHDHPRCAERALKGAGVEKRLLHWMQRSILLQSFDRKEGMSYGGADRNLAGPPRHATQQHSTRAAQAFTATVLRARQIKFVPQHIEQWSIGRIADRMSPSIDLQW